MDWGIAGVRIFIAGITLLAVCSSLLGVLLGWWLRGREVKELAEKLTEVRAELTRCWAKRAHVVMGGAAMALRRSDRGDVAGDKGECGARNYAGGENERWMLCSRPKGHHLGPNGTKHGYAGVFWGEGKGD